MCSELTSRTRKAFTEWSNRQFACFDPYLTRCRCQTTNMVPQTLSQHGLPASFYLYSWRPVRLGWKALMMHLHCQIDGDVQPHDHEKLEKNKHVRPWLRLVCFPSFTAVVSFYNVLWGCLISTFITQCPHMQQLFPWLINHLTHIETAKSCIFWSSYFWILTIYQLLLFTVCTAVCTGHIL